MDEKSSLGHASSCQGKQGKGLAKCHDDIMGPGEVCETGLIGESIMIWI